MGYNEKLKEKIFISFKDIIYSTLKHETFLNEKLLKLNDYKYKYKKYIEYRDELNRQLNSDMIEAIVAETIVSVQNAVYGTDDDFISVYPQHDRTIVKFYNWLREREKKEENDESPLFIHEIVDGKKVRKIILDIFKEQLPDFKYTTKKFSNWGMNFVKTFIGNNLIIVVDRGTKRGWIKFFISMDNPYFIIDLNDLLLLNDSAFDFSTEKEAVDVIYKAAILIEKIIVKFEANYQRTVGRH
jgi:hypothetical protein